MNDQMRQKMGSAPGFVAALDQSGGSTPSALSKYGIDESHYSGDAEMYDLIHRMRSRIITSPAFTGDRILAAILFEMTMDRTIDGIGSAEYLWSRKNVVPIVKVDKGLADEEHGARVMRPMPELDALLDRARGHGVFGTKMRSLILHADPIGVRAVVDQQFDVALRILDAGLVPIIEPEVDIHSPEKAAVEDMLLTALTEGLARVEGGRQVMFKLTLPTMDDLYAGLVGDPRVLRVVALSGGYTRDEACALLARNHGVVASFSRALTQGLHADQSDEEFDTTLAASIEEIYSASIT